MKTVVHDVMRSPEIRHHVLWVPNSSLSHGQLDGGHVHEVLLAVLTAEESSYPALDAFQWLQRVHMGVLDGINVGVNGEGVERCPESACVSSECWQSSSAVLPGGVHREWIGVDSLHILELASVLVNWHRSATSARFKKFSHVNEDETSSFAVFEDR